MAATVGFLRAVKLSWMNKTAELVLENKSAPQIREELNEYLGFEIKSATTLRKTRDVLMNAWVTPSAELSGIRKSSLLAYTQSSGNRYAVQYCVLLAAYPVVSDICGLIGKLTTIQDEFTTTWLKEKMFEAWGQRETIADSLKYILQSLRDFGVIERPKIGSHRSIIRDVESVDVINVILKTILNMKGRSYYEVTELKNVPQMFPFNFSVSLEWLHNSPEFHLNSYGGKMAVSMKDE